MLIYFQDCRCNKPNEILKHKFASRFCSFELSLARTCSEIKFKINPEKIYITKFIFIRKSFLCMESFIQYRLEKCQCEYIKKINVKSFLTPKKTEKNGKLLNVKEIMEPLTFESSLTRCLKKLGYGPEKIKKLGPKTKEFLKQTFKIPQKGDPSLLSLCLFIKQKEQQSGLNAKHNYSNSEIFYTQTISSKSNTMVHMLYRGKERCELAKNICEKNNFEYRKIGKESCIVRIPKDFLNFFLENDLLKKVFFTSDRENINDYRQFVVNYVRLFSFFDIGTPDDDKIGRAHV